MEMFDNRLLGNREAPPSDRSGFFRTYWLVSTTAVSPVSTSMPPEKVLFEKNFASLKTREYTSAREPADHPDTFLTGNWIS